MFRFLLPLLALTACVPAQHARMTATSVPAPSPCVPGYTRPDFAALERDLAAARTKWAAAQTRDYSHDFTEIAAPLAFPAVRVTVLAGQVQGVTPAAGQTGEPGPRARATIEDRFSDIARTLLQQQKEPCPAVEVEYDPADGHPTRLSSGTREANVADGWGEWRVTNLARR